MSYQREEKTAPRLRKERLTGEPQQCQFCSCVVASRNQLFKHFAVCQAKLDVEAQYQQKKGRDASSSRPPKKELRAPRPPVALPDYSAEWIALVERNKENAGVLSQLLDVLRTADMKQAPNWRPPPLVAVQAAPAATGPGKKERKYKYDPILKKAVPAGREAAEAFVPYAPDEVQFLALDLNYTAVPVHERARVLCFERGEKALHTWERVNVYYTTGTIGTCVYHPKQGATQKFRRGRSDLGCSMEEVKLILENPRSHLGYAYSKRTGLNGPDSYSADDSSIGNDSAGGLSTGVSSMTSGSSHTSGAGSYMTQDGSKIKSFESVSGFAALSDSDDEEEEEEEEDQEAGRAGSQCHDMSRAAAAESIQARYLELKIVCYMTEVYRAKAILACKRSEWIPCAEHWSLACDVLKDVTGFVDEYSIVIQLNKSANEGFTSSDTALAKEMLDSHDMPTLQRVLESSDILLEHTEQERINAEKVVLSKLVKMEAELQPHLEARDNARNIFTVARGEGAWENNANPNGKYWQARKHLELAVRELQKCVSILENVGVVIHKVKKAAIC